MGPESRDSEGREDAQKVLAASLLFWVPQARPQEGQRALCGGRTRRPWGVEVPGQGAGNEVIRAALTRVTPFGKGGQRSVGKHPVLCRRAGAAWQSQVSGAGGQAVEGSGAPPAAASGFLRPRPGAAQPAWRLLPPIALPGAAAAGPGLGAPWWPRGEGRPMRGDLAKCKGTQWEAKGGART